MRRILYQRHLKTADHVAQKDYICDYCHNPILPGDLYRIEVTALRILIAENCEFRKVKMMDTSRKHVCPDCRDPDEFVEECDRMETKRGLESSLKVA